MQNRETVSGRWRPRMGRWGVVAAAVTVVVLARQAGWADGAFDTLTEQSITQKMGAVIKLIAGIAAVVVLAVGLLVGGIKSLNGSDDAMRWIKGGIFGGFLCAACWALSQLLMSAMK